jgi:GDP-L-fucose synthase
VTNLILTGSTGFLGRNVIELLNKDINNYKISTVSRKEGVDLLNYKKTYKYFKKIKPDIVIHCAARVGGIAYNALHPVEVFNDNTNIGLNVLKATIESEANIFINVMPNCTYPGEMEEYEESKWWDGPMHPSVLTYGLPRKMLWGACSAYCSKHTSFKPIHLILPNMYGPNDHFDITRSHALGALISKIVNAKKKGKGIVDIWGTGKPVREWLYIVDGAKAIMKTLMNLEKYESNEIMNIGVTKGISIKDLAELIKQIVGWDGEFNYQTEKPDGAMKKVLIVNKMKKKLNWKPKTELREGIKQTIEWYKQNK